MHLSKPIEPSSTPIDNRLIQQLIERGECQTVEFKQQLPQPRSLAKTICAFANTHGGWLLVGIHDSGAVTGVKNVQTTRERLQTCAHFDVTPPLTIHMTIHQLQHRSILAARIPASSRKPHHISEALDRDRSLYIRNKAASVPSHHSMAKVLTQRDAPPTPSEILNELDYLNRHEQALVDYLQTNPHISQAELCRWLNLSKRRAHRLLVNLTQRGILNRLAGNGSDIYSLHPDL